MAKSKKSNSKLKQKSSDFGNLWDIGFPTGSENFSRIKKQSNSLESIGINFDFSDPDDGLENQIPQFKTAYDNADEFENAQSNFMKSFDGFYDDDIMVSPDTVSYRLNDKNYHARKIKSGKRTLVQDPDDPNNYISVEQFKKRYSKNKQRELKKNQNKQNSDFSNNDSAYSTLANGLASFGDLYNNGAPKRKQRHDTQVSYIIVTDESGEKMEFVFRTRAEALQAKRRYDGIPELRVSEVMDR